MKMLKKTLLQVGVGVVVGLGVLITGSSSAQATTPCPKDTCSFKTECSPNPPDADNPFITWWKEFKESAYEDGGCRDCDGDCKKNKVTFQVDYYSCYLLDADNPHLPPQPTTTESYEKNVAFVNDCPK